MLMTVLELFQWSWDLSLGRNKKIENSREPGSNYLKTASDLDGTLTARPSAPVACFVNIAITTMHFNHFLRLLCLSCSSGSRLNEQWQKDDTKANSS